MRGVPLDERAVIMHNFIFTQEDRKAVVSKSLDALYARVRRGRDVKSFVMPGGEVFVSEESES